MEKRPRLSTLRRALSDGSASLLRSPSGSKALEHVPTFSKRWDNQRDVTSSAYDEPQTSPSNKPRQAEVEKRGDPCLFGRLIQEDVKSEGLKKFKAFVEKAQGGRERKLNERAERASTYALDAFAGRLEHGMGKTLGKSRSINFAFSLQTSPAWYWCVFTCSLAHSLMVLCEPRSGLFHETGILRWFEVGFIAVYAADVMLKAAYMGVRTYLRKPWQELMVGVVLTLAVDASGIFSRRFALPLRPVVLSLRTRFIRRFYAVVSNMLPGFARVCVPVMFFLLLTSSLATAWFGRAKSDFENFTAAGISIWILMVCGDNYESLVNDPLKHFVYIPFVAVVIVVGSMFLLSLLLGVTYDVFIERTADQAKRQRIKQLKALNLAFLALDPEVTGKIRFPTWDRFLRHMLPRCTRQERVLYFNIASGFRDELDVIDFLNLKQVLSYSFVTSGAAESENGQPTWWWKLPGLRSLLGGMKSTLDLKLWKLSVAVVVLLDCLALPFSIPHQGPGERILFLTTFCGAVLLVDQAFQVAHWMLLEPAPRLRRLGRDWSLHAKVAGYAAVAHTVVVALLLCPRVLSSLCWGVSLAVDGWSPCAPHSAMDDSRALSGTPGDGCYSTESDNQVYWNEDWEEPIDSDKRGTSITVEWCTECLLMLAYTLRLLRCWRLVTLNDTLHSHVDTFFSVVPKFSQTLSFALVAIYAFAMSGMQILSDRASAFRDPGTSLKTTLQVFMVVDLSSTVEGTMSEAGLWAFMFFVVCHIVGVLIVFNLLTAIMIQAYGEMLNNNSRLSMEARRKADEELQELLQEFTKQKVIQLWRSRSCPQGSSSRCEAREDKEEVKTTQESEIEMKARQVLGWRIKTLAVTEEEVLKCQSYAEVDLRRALREKFRGAHAQGLDGSRYQMENEDEDDYNDAY